MHDSLNAENVKLQPCPFCDSRSITTKVDDGIHFEQCGRCEATGPTNTRYTNEEDGDSDPTWNTRTPSPLQAENDRLRVQLEAIRAYAISQDCGRLCDGNPKLVYREQWERSEQHIDYLMKLALNHKEPKI